MPNGKNYEEEDEYIKFNNLSGCKGTITWVSFVLIAIILLAVGVECC